MRNILFALSFCVLLFLVCWFVLGQIGLDPRRSSPDVFRRLARRNTLVRPGRSTCSLVRGPTGPLCERG